MIPEGKLKDAILHMGPARSQVLLEHIKGGTSSEYLSDWLKRAGYDISPTTIKSFRRKVYASE